MKISWDLYRFALVLARHRTLSGAGRELGVNQSTASRWLKQLESVSETPLFRLEDRRYEVTQAGSRWVKAGARMELACGPGQGPLVVTERRKIRVTTLEFLLTSFIFPRWKEFGFDRSINYEFETSAK